MLRIGRAGVNMDTQPTLILLRPKLECTPGIDDLL
jgi:hypothetical protein